MLRFPPEGTMTKPLWALVLLLCLAFPSSAQDLNTKLADAVRTHDAAAIERLLAEGADPNSKDKNGRTSLMEAASGGYTDTVRALLHAGADVNATDMVGWTALFWAAFSRRTDTLRALVAKGADINAKDYEGRTALFWAASSGYTDIVRVLLEKGSYVDARDSHGWTALMTAADLGHSDTVRALLDKGADVHVHGKDGSTAQSLAEKYKYTEVIAMLQKAARGPQDKRPDVAPASSPSATGAKPDSKNPATTSAPVNSTRAPALPKSEILNQKLLRAAEAGDTAEVLSLIREGAGVNARGATYGNTPLMDAAARGYTDTVRALLEKGGEVEATDNAGRTALMEAAFGGYTDTVGLLLEKGANANARDNEGWSPLFWAAFSRRTETVRFLLEKGADVSTKNKYEDTPLIHAAYGGDIDTVAALLEHHADVNAKDDMGKTALIEASRQGHADAVRLLLENGADVDLQAKDGSTALSVAVQQHFSEIVALLKNPPRKPEPGRKQASEPKTGVPDTPPASPRPTEPLAASTPASGKEGQSRGFYRLGLSMRLVEDLWPQTGRVAERAAASIVGDVRKVGGPEDLAELAQVTSNRLSFPPEDRKATAPALIGDLRRRLDKFSLAQNGDGFFYAAGGFTYDMNLLGQELTRPDYVAASVEEHRRTLLPLASNFATRCAAIADCKERALSYLSDAANLLQKSPMLPADGAALQKLCDTIGVALGTDNP